MRPARTQRSEATSERFPSPATDFVPRLRSIPPPSAPPALAETEPAFSNEVKSVAVLPTGEGGESVERSSGHEGFFEENPLFVLPLAMFVLLGGFAAIMALT